MEEQVKTKKCNRCEKVLPEDDFYRNRYLRKDGTFGLYSNCKACHYEVNYKNVQRALKKKYEQDPEHRQRVIDDAKQAMKKRVSTEEGRLKHNKYVLDYYHKHKEKILEQRRKLKEQKQNETELKLDDKMKRLKKLRQAVKVHKEQGNI